MTSKKDLDSADWLCFLTKTLVNNVNSNITVEIKKYTDSNGTVTKRLIFIRGVSQEDIQKLQFLTNTNVNNNYLYLEKFSVFLEQSPIPINIPGLEEIIIEFWRNADSNAFINDDKFFKPFENINNFIDSYTNLHVCLPKTRNLNKKYNLTLNPDICAQESFCCGGIDGGESCCPGLTCQGTASIGDGVGGCYT
jgi:hypothetical protein